MTICEPDNYIVPSWYKCFTVPSFKVLHIYMYILNNRNALQMSKFSFGDTRKVTISQDVKTNKTPDSDEKEDGDLMNS